MSYLSAYEDMLIGKTKSASLYGNSKETDAINIWRYAITNLLHWSPRDAMDCLTPEIVHKLKLDVFIKYIELPPDVDPSKDFSYIIWKCFPNDVKYKPEEQAVKMYKRILAGEKSKFPKKYFAGEYGYTKAGYILQYVISTHIPFNSISDLYAKFSNTTRMNNLLKELKLYDVSKTLYNTPLDYLHGSLAITQQDEFLYNFYKFMQSYHAAGIYYKKHCEN